MPFYVLTILGPCCLNATCTLAREFLKCYDGTECRESLVCDGLHYTCPLQKNKANLTLCDKDRSVCINGFCQGSLCLKYGYEGCLCEETSDKCKVCCQYQGKCTSSFRIPEVRLFKMFFYVSSIVRMVSTVLAHSNHPFKFLIFAKFI